MGILNITAIKIDWSKVILHDPNDPAVSDGANGYLIEDILEQHGFPVNRTATTDLPGLEVKTKLIGNGSSWTIGRMTYLDITRTKWEDSSVRKKIQKQFQVLYAQNPITLTYEVKDARVVDFTHAIIQRELKKAYESCRRQLIHNSNKNHETVKSNDYSFEYRPSKSGRGSSYSFRITTSGMKKLVATSNLLANGIFDFI
jgi:hypothetical protein